MTEPETKGSYMWKQHGFYNMVGSLIISTGHPGICRLNCNGGLLYKTGAWGGSRDYLILGSPILISNL
ncbi:hypothetical protein PM082_008590 [Marasmius tenuissimus]|nr:hypothetical protein PM082_008590 [Marasmius tenuissimus]